MSLNMHVSTTKYLDWQNVILHKDQAVEGGVVRRGASDHGLRLPG